MSTAIEEIIIGAGRQFDPQVVKAFQIAIEAGEIAAPTPRLTNHG